jgi:hypothetical protein
MVLGFYVSTLTSKYTTIIRAFPQEINRIEEAVLTVFRATHQPIPWPLTKHDVEEQLIKQTANVRKAKTGQTYFEQKALEAAWDAALNFEGALTSTEKEYYSDKAKKFLKS